MSNLIASAKEYLSYQLSVIPTKEDKRPALSWTPYQNERMRESEVERNFAGKNVQGLGIVCGAVSGNLEVIDVDTKYDLTGTLWEEFKELIEGTLPDVWETLVVAETKSGGYHIYYRCDEVSGNLKLANRPTTAEEKAKTCQKEIDKGATAKEANTRAANDNTRVLLETRGEGGCVIAYPTTGYQYIQGDLSSIPTITQEQRRILHAIAKSFDQTPTQEETPKGADTSTSSAKDSSNKSPFDDYNERGDLVGFLEGKGWKVVSGRGTKVHLLRPGQTDTKTSGNFHKEKRKLWIALG